MEDPCCSKKPPGGGLGVKPLGWKLQGERQREQTAAVPLLPQPQAQEKGGVGPAGWRPFASNAGGGTWPVLLCCPGRGSGSSQTHFPFQTKLSFSLAPSWGKGPAGISALLSSCIRGNKHSAKGGKRRGGLELGWAGLAEGQVGRQRRASAGKPQARGTGRALAGWPLCGLGNQALEARVASSAFASSKGLWKGIHPHGQLQAPYPYPHGREALLLPGMQQGLF